MTSIHTPIRSVWPFYAVAWLSIGAINLAAYVANGIPMDLAIRNAVGDLLPDAALGLVVLQLPARLPRPEHSWLRGVAIHIALLALFVALSTRGWVAMIRARKADTLRAISTDRSRCIEVSCNGQDPIFRRMF